MANTENVTRRLAEWASQLSYDQIPPEVVREARRWGEELRVYTLDEPRPPVLRRIRLFVAPG